MAFPTQTSKVFHRLLKAGFRSAQLLGATLRPSFTSAALIKYVDEKELRGEKVYSAFNSITNGKSRPELKQLVTSHPHSTAERNEATHGACLPVTPSATGLAFAALIESRARP